MVNSHNNRLIRICFYSLWLLVSILQAYNTELLADEAYYWKYAQNLSWGYFDHPPVVAAMIKAGFALLQNELGVRLFFITGSVLFLYILELLVQPENLVRYYLSVASIGAFHFIGFLALPDMPLLLFSVLFLFLFKSYIEKDNWITAIMLAVCTTLLLLSKYHGILLIAFAIVTNPQLLKRGTFWFITLASAAMFLPHVFWQFDHNLPSVKYHLQGRSNGGYKPEYTLNYILSAIVMFSPVTGIIFAWKAIKKRTEIRFDKTLRYFLIGSLSFFFLMSFKGKTEANWVAMSIIPAFILGYSYSEEQIWFKKYTLYAASISLVLIGVLRIYLIDDYLADSKLMQPLHQKLHNADEWTKAIEERAGERPVVFMNKYQYAAWYEYYTGHNSISLNNRMGRKNQYNIWEDEHLLQGANIMLIPNYPIDGMESIETPKGRFQYMYLDNFRSSSPIVITPEQRELTGNSGDSVSIDFTITGPTEQEWDIEANTEYLPALHTMTFRDGKFISNYATGFSITKEMVNDGMTYNTTIVLPAEPGEYQIFLDIGHAWLPPGINGKKTDVLVTAD